jgi:stage IV sporulation protein FB
MASLGRPLDNPINWSFPLGRVLGIQVRVHIAFVICAVVLIWMELPDAGTSQVVSAWQIFTGAVGTYALLFAVVLLHEFGHCFGARSVGGQAEEILLWPLGGLASVQPPHDPRSHTITTLAGPMVNVAICGVCSAVLAAWCGTLAAVPWNPLHPMQPLDPLLYVTPGQQWLIRLFGVSYFLLLINLLPIFPFDGGRILQAALWVRKDFYAATEVATGIGMIGAIALGLFALFIEPDQKWLLMMIAVFGYLTCYVDRRMLREQGTGQSMDFGSPFAAFDPGRSCDPDSAAPRMSLLARRRVRKLQRIAEQERADRQRLQEEVDDILRKVARHGMDSLTAAERRVLEEETRRIRD